MLTRGTLQQERLDRLAQRFQRRVAVTLALGDDIEHARAKARDAAAALDVKLC